MITTRERFHRGFLDGSTAAFLDAQAALYIDPAWNTTYAAGYSAGWSEMRERMQAASKRRYPIYVRATRSDSAWNKRESGSISVIQT